MATAQPLPPPSPRPAAPFAFDRSLPAGTRARARQRAEVKARIGLAALELGESRGFDAVTAEEIARAAGVSRATFFRHFPRKEAALFSWREAWLDEFETFASKHTPDDTGFDAVRRAFARIGRLYEAHREHMVRHNAVVAASPSLLAHEAAVDRDWEQAIVRIVSRAGPLDERRARWFGAAVLGVLRTTVREWFQNDAETDLVETGLEAMSWLVDLSGRAAND